MVIYTSYFSKLGKLRETDLLPVSIAQHTPNFFAGVEVKELAPERGMLKLSEEEYRPRYNAVLNRVNPMALFKQLEIMCRNHQKNGVVLLCFESPEKFCHRHLVADWFWEKLGVDVKEWDYIPKEIKEVPKQFNLFK